jgi:hypothetical protein
VKIENPAQSVQILDEIAEASKPDEGYIVAAYYFGNFHADPRNVGVHGVGWTEWQLVRGSQPRFPGHRQPKVPLWGYEDDSNHDWTDTHLKFPGEVTPNTFDTLTTHVVDEYFSKNSYLKIYESPYFSVYELYRFVLGMGGYDQAATELEKSRDKVKAAGFPDLHLNAITWGVQLLPGSRQPPDLKAMLQKLGVDSATSYVWIHHVQLNNFPVPQYDYLAAEYETYRSTASEQLGKPYFPNISVGWDASPRACQTDILTNATYPFMPVVQGNTPERVGQALSSAKEFLVASGLQTKLITVNSWNEWTEGSYLEPDTDNGYGFLEQIRRVFGRKI